MAQPTTNVELMKKRVLASFRKHKHMVREDDTMDWNDLSRVIQALDPKYCTDERMAELKRHACIDVIGHPGDAQSQRIRLVPFINWIFVDDEVKQGNSQAGNLRYPVRDEDLQQALELVGHMRTSAEVDPARRAQQALRRLWPNSCEPTWPKRDAGTTGQGRLFFVITDLEPDDIMAVAQLWEWKREHRCIDGQPLVVFAADFAEKDGGTVLEKKELLASLILGLSKYYVLTHEGDDGKSIYKVDKSVHPQQRQLVQQRSRYLEEICQELEAFQGTVIDFYLIAPGAGNFGAILRTLKARKSWPLKAKWKISLYSGSYNVRGMAEEDLNALREVMTMYAEGPLIDVGKFPFFGGKDCHEMTDSLTTFAMPSFAKDLSVRAPVHASMLKLFNDEFNAGLIDPSGKKLFGGKTLTDEERARLEEIGKLYVPSDKGKLQEYARRMIEHEGLSAKMADFKRSTFKAYAYGGCDSPLCDQLLFLHEWLETKNPHFLVYEDGYWHFNKEKGFTEIRQTSDGSPGAFKARRPKLQEPRQAQNLMLMSQTLESYLLRQIYTLDCHVGKSAGRLNYHPPRESQDRCQAIVDRVHAAAEDVDTVVLMEGMLTPEEWRPVDAPSCQGDRLMFVLTDMEPDDMMAVAQLWEWKKEEGHPRVSPIIVFVCDFEQKDGGTVFEKKRLMSDLLFLPRHYTLTGEADTAGQQVDKNSKTIHPRNKVIWQNRQAEIDRICEDLGRFNGKVVDLYIISPGLGTISAILNRLKHKGKWPLPSRPKWRVTLYSGQYNMGGTTPDDLLALDDIMRQSDQPLVDIGKFPFFGGRKCHPWTDSLTTFASPNLASEISRNYPLLAAVFTSFNDEFNAGLVNPLTKDFFKKSPLTEDEAKRYAKYKAGFVYGDAASLRKFCSDVLQDTPIFDKLPDFKKSTFTAFAHGGCDSPLCDQLVFAYEYLKARNPGAMKLETGQWCFDGASGSFTELRKEGGRFPGLRPALADPLDEAVLTDLRLSMEKFLLDHLKEMSCHQGSSAASGEAGRRQRQYC